MDIAASLGEARRHAGLSQAHLAARAGTSQATISAYESGRKQPSVATLGRLLAVTGMRLVIERAYRPVRAPSAAQLARAGKGLVEVLGLAEELPVRHAARSLFPRLHTPEAGSA